MALSIKNTETERLARELAQVMGETVTVAVTEAVSARLASVRAAGDDRARRLERLRRIAADASPRWRSTTADPSVELYDERGLPR